LLVDGERKERRGGKRYHGAGERNRGLCQACARELFRRASATANTDAHRAACLDRLDWAPNWSPGAANQVAGISSRERAHNKHVGSKAAAGVSVISA
jgi:hypothetical protein